MKIYSWIPFFSSVSNGLLHLGVTLDYALPCVKPNQMRQIGPGALGREEGGHWVMLPWPGAQPGSAQSRGPCMGQASCGYLQAGVVTWALIWASSYSGKSPGVFIFPVKSLPLCTWGCTPTPSLHGAGISWLLLPVGCTCFFTFFSSVAWCDCEKYEGCG